MNDPLTSFLQALDLSDTIEAVNFTGRGHSGDDIRFMRRALTLTTKAKTHPNPCVGAVLVKDGAIVGEGFTYGIERLHAEAMALHFAGEKARGATLYVTLEPCSHIVRSDGSPRIPCARRCVDAGVARVVCALLDPDPQVNGDGFSLLRSAGISVEIGLLEAEARRAHEAFLKHRTTGLPFVVHKAAMTLDGKLAAVSGDSRWVTGAAARAAVHRLREHCDAIVVGAATIRADNPQLNVRPESGGRRSRRLGNETPPLRVILDSKLTISPDARALGNDAIVYTTDAAPGENRRRIEATGAEVMAGETDENGRVDVRFVVRDLADRGFLLVLLESGGALASSFHKAELVDRCWFFVAPKLIGGADSPTPIDGVGLADRMAGAVNLTRFRVRRYGEDIAFEAEVARVHGDR